MSRERLKGLLSLVHSPILRSICIGLAMLLSCSIGSATAQTSADVDRNSAETGKICTLLGGPADIGQMQTLSGHIVESADGSYFGVLGDFEGGRARLARYFLDGHRDVKFAYIESRKLCLFHPTSEKQTCAVPISCETGESEFVISDSSDQFAARLLSEQEGDAHFSALHLQNDWVEFAGGTFDLVIESAPLKTAGEANSKSARFGNRCKIGQGHPVIDQSFAYYWNAECRGENAEGDGNLLFLTSQGEIGQMSLGEEKGIAIRNGSLFWSFPPTAASVEVVCINSDDSAVPTASEDVAQIQVGMTIGSSIDIGDTLIRNKIVSDALPIISQICGTSAPPERTIISFFGASGSDIPLFKIDMLDYRKQSSGTISVAQAVPLLGYSATRAAAEQTFADYIRLMVDQEQSVEVLHKVRLGQEIDNIANAMVESDVETLVALNKGARIWMPWAGTNPSFANGTYSVSWTTNSTDPADDFFSLHTTSGWQRIRRRVPDSEKSAIIARISCEIPERDAQKIQPNDWVSVNVKMVGYSSNSFRLSCTSL